VLDREASVLHPSSLDMGVVQDGPHAASGVAVSVGGVLASVEGTMGIAAREECRSWLAEAADRCTTLVSAIRVATAGL